MTVKFVKLVLPNLTLKLSNIWPTFGFGERLVYHRRKCTTPHFFSRVHSLSSKLANVTPGRRRAWSQAQPRHEQRDAAHPEDVRYPHSELAAAPQPPAEEVAAELRVRPARAGCYGKFIRKSEHHSYSFFFGRMRVVTKMTEN